MKWWEYFMIICLVGVSIGFWGVCLRMCDEYRTQNEIYRAELEEYRELVEGYRADYERELSRVDEALAESVKFCDNIVDAVIKGRW